MANQRITSLTALLGVDVADDDVFPVVDISDTTHNATGTTKKITKSELSGIFGSGSTEGLTESTTARTLVIGDAAKFIWCTHADGCDITIPPQSSVTWADDTEIHGLGTLGDVTFTEGTGVTITPVNSQLKTATATTAWTLKRFASDSWWLICYDGVTGGGGGSSSTSRAIISDTKSNGTDGGTFTSGAWQTRDLNTEDYDADGIVSIASNQFTLQAGTYRIYATAPAERVGRHKAQLYNVTDSSTTLLGTNGYNSTSADQAQTRSIVSGVFAIPAAKAFEIRHICETTKTNLGLGVAGNFGVNEVYSLIEIEKLS